MIRRSSYDYDEQDIHDRWVRFKEGVLTDAGDHAQRQLTKRELDVLSHLVYGEKNKDIADSLGVKTITVKVHVRSICRKLDVSNRTQAALYASEHCLFEKKNKAPFY